MDHVRQGDILRLANSPAYALVVSRDFFNQSGMAVLCPIVRFAEEDALHFPFQTKELQGVILAEQMKSIDLSVRYYQTVSSLSIAQLQDVCDAVQDIFAYYPYSVL